MGTILVIDDQEPIRTLLRAALEGDGHEVLEASNGLLGLERYRERAADLVIIDMLMPEMNGLELMRSSPRSFLNVKVIAMSGVPQRRKEGYTPLSCWVAAGTFSKSLRDRSVTRCPSIRMAQYAKHGDPWVRLPKK